MLQPVTHQFDGFGKIARRPTALPLQGLIGEQGMMQSLQNGSRTISTSLELALHDSFEHGKLASAVGYHGDILLSEY